MRLYGVHWCSSSFSDTCCVSYRKLCPILSRIYRYYIPILLAMPRIPSGHYWAIFEISSGNCKFKILFKGHFVAIFSGYFLVYVRAKFLLWNMATFTPARCHRSCHAQVRCPKRKLEWSVASARFDRRCVVTRWCPSSLSWFATNRTRGLWEIY